MRNNKGFTLLELMIAVAIAAIVLATIMATFDNNPKDLNMYGYERAEKKALEYLRKNNIYEKRLNCNSDGLCSVHDKAGNKFMLSCPTSSSKSKESCIELFNFEIKID